jgi:hypothetical protein
MNSDFAVKVEVVKLNFEPGAKAVFQSLSSSVLMAKEQLSLFYVLGQYLGMKRLELAVKGLDWNGNCIRIFLSEVEGFRAPTWFFHRIEKLAKRNNWPIRVLVKVRERSKAERLKAL